MSLPEEKKKKCEGGLKLPESGKPETDPTRALTGVRR